MKADPIIKTYRKRDMASPQTQLLTELYNNALEHIQQKVQYMKRTSQVADTNKIGDILFDSKVWGAEA